MPTPAIRLGRPRRLTSLPVICSTGWITMAASSAAARCRARGRWCPSAQRRRRAPRRETHQCLPRYSSGCRLRQREHSRPGAAGGDVGAAPDGRLLRLVGAAGGPSMPATTRAMVAGSSCERRRLHADVERCRERSVLPGARARRQALARSLGCCRVAVGEIECRCGTPRHGSRCSARSRAVRARRCPS